MESGPDGGADQGSLMMRLRNHNPGGPPPTNGKFHNFSESLLKRHRFQMLEVIYTYRNMGWRFKGNRKALGMCNLWIPN